MAERRYKKKAKAKRPRPARSKRPGVPCPLCGSGYSKVIRTTRKGLALQRRRECLNCCKRFSTWEATKKNDTGVGDLAAGVISLIRSLGLHPSAVLPQVDFQQKEKREQ